MRRGGRIQKDESGAALVLAIVFMVVCGAIGSALLTNLASGTYNRNTLDLVRNRQYAADGAIEDAIAQTRLNMTLGTAPYCGSTTKTINAVPITVECIYTQTQTLSGFVQRNATYAARCSAVQAPICPSTGVIIRAQVNFRSASLPAATVIVVDGTYVQSWNVAT